MSQKIILVEFMLITTTTIKKNNTIIKGFPVTTLGPKKLVDNFVFDHCRSR